MILSKSDILDRLAEVAPDSPIVVEIGRREHTWDGGDGRTHGPARVTYRQGRDDRVIVDVSPR